ncbi:hypothetical protein M406DRAFT_75813 [Cryphonectria parasitica EP155]|uniref:Uncharacterized protein n=1 Tax=Cryphonectria parasitica (strain ATCC 38755 / EP155) TaxID=660469 RepID=A0A9P4YA95_CRYP1|nr:uncharacterized protein M406DRAFT_75813 [Cryphonectria parasitica EP155]KAF3769330.1 hypothetical protein M406DRAFT_75813 [Cryphonectria parasitica EP155]
MPWDSDQVCPTSEGSASGPLNMGREGPVEWDLKHYSVDPCRETNARMEGRKLKSEDTVQSLRQARHPGFWKPSSDVVRSKPVTSRRTWSTIQEEKDMYDSIAYLVHGSGSIRHKRVSRRREAKSRGPDSKNICEGLWRVLWDLSVNRSWYEEKRHAEREMMSLQSSFNGSDADPTAIDWSRPDILEI